jgi:hypothetical protein
MNLKNFEKVNIVFFSSVVIFLIPSLLRWIADNPLLVGTNPYKLALFVESFGVPRIFSEIMVIVFSVLLTSLGILLIHQTLKIRKLPVDKRLAIITILAVSPGLLGATTFFPLRSFIFFIIALGLFLIHIKSKLPKITGGLLLFSVCFNAIDKLISSEFSFTLTRTLSELGGVDSYGLFALLAAIVGGTVLWRNKAKYYFAAVGLLTLVIISFFNISWVFFGSLGISVVAGIGFIELIKRDWEFEIIRTLSIILFICGILFSSITFITLIKDAPPGLEMAAGLSNLRYTLPEGNTISQPENTEWLEYWANATIIVLPEDDLQDVWQSRSIDDTAALLIANNVTSIVITPNMKEGEVWSDEEQGLLFLLEHSETFKKLHSGNFIEAWRFKKEKVQPVK